MPPKRQVLSPHQVEARRSVDIVERLREPRAFGKLFSPLEPWSRWLAALRLLYGLPLEPGDAEICAEHASAQPREGGYRTALFLCGRQSGKSSIASAIGLHEALSARVPNAGQVYSLLVAQDQRCAERVSYAYAKSLVESSKVYQRWLLTKPYKLEMGFDNGANLLVLPSNAAAIRGYRAVCAVIDECCFLGDGADEEIVTAIRPTLSSTDGRLILISSPGAPSGVAYELVQRKDPDVLVWRAPSYKMNPTISQTFLDQLKRHDLMAYDREIEGNFGATSSTLLDSAQVEAACRKDAKHLEPKEGNRYAAFVDVSGGRIDRAALAIVHTEEGKAIIDALHYWAPPFSPADFVDSCLPFLSRYGVRSVKGDYFAAEINADLWRVAGIDYQRSHLNRSQILMSMVPIFAGGLCSIPRDELLVKEFKALQRRSLRSGREVADHPSSGSDDVCNAVSGAIVHALKFRPNPWETWQEMLDMERQYVESISA